MRRQGGHYGGDAGGFGGAAAQMHHQQQLGGKSGYYPGRYQEQQQQLVDGKDGGKPNNRRRWEPDGLQQGLPQTAMSPTAPSSYSQSQGPGRETPTAFYQDQRLESRYSSEKQSGWDVRPQPREPVAEAGYEDTRAPETFEGLEKRILDEVMKLWEEKSSAEDAENSSHRERINAINLQYEEQLASLRAQHASQREEFLRRESQARKDQYQKVLMEQYPASRGPEHAGEPYRDYNIDAYAYREQGRVPFGGRDHGYESKAPFRGRGYNAGPRYYN